MGTVMGGGHSEEGILVGFSHTDAWLRKPVFPTVGGQMCISIDVSAYDSYNY